MEMTFTSEIKVDLVQKMGGDHMVVAAAKVSTSGEEARKFAQQACAIHSPMYPEWQTCERCQPFRELQEGNYKLIRYLMSQKHGSPFEHSGLTLFVHAPIFVWREWHRHRIGFAYSDYGYDESMLGQSFNEESGRYKTLDPVFYIPPRDRPMIKVEGWKPGRPKFLALDEHFGDEETYGGDHYPSQANRMKKSDDFYQKMVEDMKQGYEEEHKRYLRQLDRNIDPGLARDCLPVGIYSSCWVTCNPRSLMAFLSLRTHDETSKFVSYPLYEIEVAARKVEAIFAEDWPLTYRAFQECGRVAP